MGAGRRVGSWHTQPTPESPVGSANTLAWADGVSVLSDLPCFLDNFYVKSPDLQILDPVFLKIFYVS